MNHSGTVLEISGKEFFEDVSQEKGFYKWEGRLDASNDASNLKRDFTCTSLGVRN